MANEQSQKGRGGWGYQIDDVTYAKRGLFKIRTCAHKGMGGKD